MSDESTREEKADADAKADHRSSRGKRLATGLAFGIGSAAIVAALLFANRSRNNPDN